MNLTHFSRVTDVGRLGEVPHRQLDVQHIDNKHVEKTAADRLAAISRDLEMFFRTERERLHWEINDAEFDRIVMPDVRLNAMGLESWLGNPVHSRRPT